MPGLGNHPPPVERIEHGDAIKAADGSLAVHVNGPARAVAWQRG